MAVIDRTTLGDKYINTQFFGFKADAFGGTSDVYFAPTGDYYKKRASTGVGALAAGSAGRAEGKSLVELFDVGILGLPDTTVIVPYFIKDDDKYSKIDIIQSNHNLSTITTVDTNIGTIYNIDNIFDYWDENTIPEVSPTETALAAGLRKFSIASSQSGEVFTGIQSIGDLFTIYANNFDALFGSSKIISERISTIEETIDGSGSGDSLTSRIKFLEDKWGMSTDSDSVINKLSEIVSWFNNLPESDSGVVNLIDRVNKLEGFKINGVSATQSGNNKWEATITASNIKGSGEVNLNYFSYVDGEYSQLTETILNTNISIQGAFSALANTLYSSQLAIHNHLLGVVENTKVNNIAFGPSLAVTLAGSDIKTAAAQTKTNQQFTTNYKTGDSATIAANTTLDNALGALATTQAKLMSAANTLSAITSWGAKVNNTGTFANSIDKLQFGVNSSNGATLTVTTSEITDSRIKFNNAVESYYDANANVDTSKTFYEFANSVSGASFNAQDHQSLTNVLDALSYCLNIQYHDSFINRNLSNSATSAEYFAYPYYICRVYDKTTLTKYEAEGTFTRAALLTNFDKTIKQSIECFEANVDSSNHTVNIDGWTTDCTSQGIFNKIYDTEAFKALSYLAYNKNQVSVKDLVLFLFNDHLATVQQVKSAETQIVNAQKWLII